MNEKNTKKVVACIIVRMKSTRLPQKALADLCGYTMMEQLIRRLKTSKTITKIVVCTSSLTSDAILLEKAKEWGVDGYAGHPEDVLSRLIDVAKIYKADMVLRITGDNPFTDVNNIDRMVVHHIKTSSEYTRTNRLPLGVTAEVMAASMLMKLHNSMPDPNQSEYMSFFAFNPQLFHCEVLKPLANQDRPYYSLTIDYPNDLELARKIYTRLSIDGSIPSLDEVISYLDQDRSYKSVEKDTLIKLTGSEVMKFSELIQMLDEKALEASNVKVLS